MSTLTLLHRQQESQFGHPLWPPFSSPPSVTAFGCVTLTPAPPPPLPQAYVRQRGLFMAQVGNVARLPLLKQYLLLYSSISLPKLAGLLETDEGTLRMALACLKKANYW